MHSISTTVEGTCCPVSRGGDRASRDTWCLAHAGCFGTIGAIDASALTITPVTREYVARALSSH